MNRTVALVNNLQNNDNSYRQKFIRERVRLHHLDDEEKDLITQLCVDFSDIIYLEGDSLALTIEIKHNIEMSNPKPIFTKSYLHLSIYKQKVRFQISKMLDQSITRPSVSPWSSVGCPKKT